MNECDVNANCSNTVGSYSCFCLSGFEGNGFNCLGTFLSVDRKRRCHNNILPTLLMYTDINECDRDLDNCDINAECSNIVGSFYCTCNMGYTGTGVMSDCGESHSSLINICRS